MTARRDDRPVNREALRNPISSGIAGVWAQYETLDFSGENLLPSLVASAALGIVLLVLLPAWPLGFIPVTATQIWRLMRDGTEKLRAQQDAIQQMPWVVAIGIYFLVWLPFALLSLPFVILGELGRALVRLNLRELAAAVIRTAILVGTIPFVAWAAAVGAMPPGENGFSFAVIGQVLLAVGVVWVIAGANDRMP